MYNGAAQRSAVAVASELADVFNHLYGNVEKADAGRIHMALRAAWVRAEREFTAAGALDESRRKLLSEAEAELQVARVAAENQQPGDAINALKRAAGRINALVADVMGKMG